MNTVRMSVKNKCLMICVANSITQTFDKSEFFYSSVIEDSDYLGCDAGSFE